MEAYIYRKTILYKYTFDISAIFAILTFYRGSILPRDAMLARYMLWRSVCSSVCRSDTSRYYTKTAKYRITETMLYDSPGTLVFIRQKSPERKGRDPGHVTRPF